jgi:hypothetical protein
MVMPEVTSAMAATAFWGRYSDRDGKRGRHAQAGAQRHQHPGHQQHGEARCHHSQQVAGDETAQRERQHGSSVKIIERHRQNRRTNRIGQGVGRHQLSCRGQGNLQVRCNNRQ